MRHRSRSILVILALAVTALLAGALPVAASSATGINVRLPAGHTISGNIVRASNNAPVFNAYIYASSAAGFSYGSTDSSGNYTINALRNGSWTLYVYPPDPLLSGYYTTANANHFTTNVANADPVVINNNNPTGKNMKLPVAPAGHSISGRITRNGGANGVADADVSASGTGYGSATTASNGNFTISGLPNGTYSLSVDAGDGIDLQAGCFKMGVAGNFQANCASPTTLTINNNNLTGKNVNLPNGLHITGTVTKRSGTPLEGILVETDATGTLTDRSDYTDSNGNFTIVGLSPGQYTDLAVGGDNSANVLAGFWSNGNTYRWVPGMASATAFNLTANRPMGTIKPANGFTISGHVAMPNGSAAQYASVYAEGDNLNNSGYASTDASGNYTMMALAPDNYTLFFDAPYSAPNVQSSWYRSSTPTTHLTDVEAQTTKVTVGPNKTNVNVKLVNGFSISGTITKAGGGPVLFASVTATRTSDSRQFFGYTSSLDGTYSITGMPAGTFTVEVVNYGNENLLDGFYKAGAPGNYTASEAQATPVTI